MALDLWPYSQRLSGAVTDLEHEALWRPIADGILPGQLSTAMAVTAGGGNWSVAAGKFHIAGHVLTLSASESGPLPAGSTATRTSIVVAYVDRTQSPWTYGVKLRQGAPGGGRPAPQQTDTGLWEVPLRAFDTATTGATTLLADERVFLSRVGGEPAVGAWTTLSLAGGYSYTSYAPTARLSQNGKRLSLRGTIRRIDGDGIIAGGGPTLLTLPGWARPVRSFERYTAATSIDGVGQSGSCRVDVLSTGALRVWTDLAPNWIDISGSIWIDN